MRKMFVFEAIMATPLIPEKTYFFVAVLAADENCLRLAREALTAEWGEIAQTSPVYPFYYTNYYARETGEKILRVFFAFAEPFAREQLAERKLRANELEKLLAEKIGGDWSRPVNLDPGYLALDKLVLASCKDFAHRIYLHSGVFAEITLSYRGGKFTAFPWTFPDYGSGDYHLFFYALRDRLKITHH